MATPDLKMQLFVDKVPQMVGASDLAASGFMYAPTTTADRDLIASPGTGEVIYNTTTNKLNFYNGTAWEEVTSAVTVVTRSAGAATGVGGKAPDHKAQEPAPAQHKATPAPTDHHNK